MQTQNTLVVTLSLENAVLIQLRTMLMAIATAALLTACSDGSDVRPDGGFRLQGCADAIIAWTPQQWRSQIGGG